MLLTIGYCNKDADQAERLAAWMQELGGLAGHKILVARDASSSAQPFKDIGFDAYEEFVISDDVWMSWPQSCNNAFKKICKHVEYSGHPEPFLWLEPDVVPWHEGWIAALVAEYGVARSAGKMFLADFVSVHTKELDVPDHGSGVGIYPGKMTAHAGNALLTVDTAWDVAAAPQILPKLHKSSLISHSWKHKAFENWEQVEREILAFKPQIALYHADKSGSLYPLLRAKRNPQPVNTFDPLPIKTAFEQPVAVCDIFIKSYPPDYDLLGYCLRSIEKFATGFRRVVIVIPKGTHPLKDTFPFTISVIETVENGDGYLYQQAIKAGAHEFTDADYILHIDSDTLLSAPVTPQTFMENGKPIWLMTPYSAIQTPWQPITEKFLGEPVEFEFMRRFPFLIPGFLHVAISAFALAKHGVRLTDYIMSQPHREFSEFNALGALAYSRARDQFAWHNTLHETFPPQVAQSFTLWGPDPTTHLWTHHPLTPEVRARLENILSGGVESRHAHSEGDHGVQVPPANARQYPTGIASGSSAPPAQNFALIGEIRQTAAGLWIINGDTHISKLVEEKGQLQHDFQTLPLILPEINAGDVVVDIGANIGDTTGPFLDCVGPHGVVYAFEPHEAAYECLVRNCPAAYAKRYALGSYQDNVAMRVGDNGNFGATTVGKKKDGEHGATVRTLDSYDLKHCDFIKIDVEGYELKVLQGAERTIERFRPKLAIEINERALQRQGTGSAEIFLWLWSHGYQSFPLVTPDLNQPMPQFDILCRPVPEWQPGEHDKELAGPVKPWVSKLESIERIKVLVKELKTFCTCPMYTNKVRAELLVAHITPGKPRGRVPYHAKKTEKTS